MCQPSKNPFVTVVAICIGLTAIAFASYGFPANYLTWAWFIIALLLCLPMLWTRRWKRLLPFPLMFFVPVLVPYKSNYIMDIRGGRRGIELWPGFFKFGGAGINTRLVESYLGPTEPQWCRFSQRSTDFALHQRTCEHEHYHSASLLFRRSLGNILDKLPDDDARRQVLTCMYEPRNLRKFHQEMLLVCLHEYGYPRGYDSETWWQKHGHLFQREFSPKACTEKAGAWVHRAKQYPDQSNDLCSLTDVAERYQEAMWGEGIPTSAVISVANQLKVSISGFGMNNVVWWQP